MRRILIVLIPLLIAACSPFYVIRAAYEESKILLAREDIPEVIESPETDAEERRKLELVLAARSFGISIGLKPKDSFTQYTKVDRDILAWVLMAVKKDSFSLKTWWFPIVGSVPYKGYFGKNDAMRAARRLERKGYESWVRGTEAFSTLGWFNDPILSTTLRHSDLSIVNTVLHESFHSTLWIPNYVDFNESVANFIGFQATIDFYQKRLSDCKEDMSCSELEEKVKQAKVRKKQELSIGAAIEKLFEALNKLYSSNSSSEKKIAQREEVFNTYVSPLRAIYPKMKILKEINNAEILQLKLYLTRLELFERFFQKLGHSWPAFLTELEQVAEKIEDDSERNPFELIDERIAFLSN